MERIQIKAPLACFGLEHSATDEACCACPHQAECVKFMGFRAGKIPLDKIRFSLFPKGVAPFSEQENLESPTLNALYLDCYKTVFNKKPETRDSASQFQVEIQQNARRARCLTRLFILANMVAHSLAQGAEIDFTERGKARRFHAGMLKGNLAVYRAEKYGKLCNDRYGTFCLTSLAALSESDLELNEMETLMLNSEVTAGQFIVSRKIHVGRPPFEALYEAEEFKLDPRWLAIEDNYVQTVLLPYNADKRGGAGLKDHRHSVNLTLGEMKRSKTYQKLAFHARQKIMPTAVTNVLSYFNLKPSDFLYPAVPVTNALQFWVDVGRTIQHYHCWLTLQGAPSYYTR